jgi:hypothetical protein
VPPGRQVGIPPRHRRARLPEHAQTRSTHSQACVSLFGSSRRVRQAAEDEASCSCFPLARNHFFGAMAAGLGFKCRWLWEGALVPGDNLHLKRTRCGWWATNWGGHSVCSSSSTWTRNMTRFRIKQSPRRRRIRHVIKWVASFDMPDYPHRYKRTLHGKIDHGVGDAQTQLASSKIILLLLGGATEQLLVLTKVRC